MDFRQDELKAWLFDKALPLWWTVGADHERGGFHELIGLDGRPVQADRRARVQARQTFVYSCAGTMGWQGPWRRAVAHGLDFFIGRYRRPDGLYRTVVSAEGLPVDDSAWLYDQAFALFAMAAAARALPERAELPGQARALLEALQARRHPAGGFVETGPAPYQSNPHMHLFEAALAWEAISPDPAWRALADEVAALALTHFIDARGGYLREFFGPDWAPAAGLAGRIVEPGHQFEWAWLMARWARLRGRSDAQAAALGLYRIAVDHGLDPRRGVAVNQLLDGDLSVHDASARLWPQTERIKAARILLDSAAPAEATALAAQVRAGVDGLMLYFDTPAPGLWRDRFLADGTFVQEPAPASSLYHIICAVEAAAG